MTDYPVPSDAMLAHAYAEWAKEHYGGDFATHLARAIQSISESDLEARAEAWDEGKRAGLRQSDWEHGDTPTMYVAVNPYRKEQAEMNSDLAEAWEEGAETAWNRSTPEVNGTRYHWRHEGEPVNPYRQEKDA